MLSHATLNIKGVRLPLTLLICHTERRRRRRRGGGERIYLSTRYITAAAMAICHRVAAQWPTRQLEKCTGCRRFRKGTRKAASLCVPLPKAGRSAVFQSNSWFINRVRFLASLDQKIMIKILTIWSKMWVKT